MKARSSLLLVGLIILALFILWDTPFVMPLKILTVFFHESSHALMTIISGGKVVDMAVFANQSGHVMHQGGSRFLVLSAGYLGSLLWGYLIYLVSIYSSRDKKMVLVLAIIMAAITIFLVRNLFGFVFLAAFVCFLVFSALKLSNQVNDIILRVIGLASIGYTPWDILQDTIFNSQARSDAFMLGQEFFGNAWFWGGIWFIVSVFVIYKLVIATLKHHQQNENQSK